jgi:hypothetical protein
MKDARRLDVARGQELAELGAEAGEERGPDRDRGIAVRWRRIAAARPLRSRPVVFTLAVAQGTTARDVSRPSRLSSGIAR